MKVIHKKLRESMGSPDPLVEAGRAPWKKWRVNSAFNYLEMQRIGVWGRVNAQRWDAVLPSGNVWKAEPKRKRQEGRMGWSAEGIQGGPNCLTLSALGGRASNHLCVTLQAVDSRVR